MVEVESQDLSRDCCVDVTEWEWPVLDAGRLRLLGGLLDLARACGLK